MTTDTYKPDIYNPDAQEELSVQQPLIYDKPAQPCPRSVKIAFGMAAALAAGYAAYDELMVSSRIQAAFFQSLHKGDLFTKTVNTPPPAEGNTDVERGYADIQRIRALAEKAGYQVSPQVSWQDRQIGPLHLAPLFPRPAQAGVTIRGHDGEIMYENKSPHAVYQQYQDIPGILTRSLCFVEDQQVCDPAKEITYNAAINWPRTAWAGVLGLGRKFGMVSKVEGGSTLAIQTTKLDSWEDGRTRGFTDKAEQMLTASAEMYGQGLDTTAQRQKTILEYTNGVLFAGHPQYGEVRGFKDGMAIWFGVTDYDKILSDGADTQEKARIVRKMLTLTMAVKMPDRGLRDEEGFKDLQERVDKYIPLLVEEGILTASLGRMVLDEKLEFADVGLSPVIPPVPQRDKHIDSVRLALMNELGLNPVDAMYRLDRWDMQVDASLDHRVTQAVTEKLKSFNDPEIARKNGLIGFQLLRPETAPKVTWAITINERLPDGHVVSRVSTDTFKGDLDLTKGGRQNYGSTGKMRMSATFLEVITELHDEYAGKDPETLKTIKPHPKDKLTKWALDYLSNPENDHSLKAMLSASVRTIKYSGAPQGFFTGGGMNYPGNFDRREDRQSYTVEEALWESVNLSWYRITYDIQEYMKWHRLKIDPAIFDDGPLTPDQQAQRRKYLERFADFEGSVYSRKFWKQQKEQMATDIAFQLTGHEKDGKEHRSAIYLTVYPEASFEQYSQFMDKNCKGCAEDELKKLYQEHKKDRQTDLATALAAQTDRSPAALATVHRFVNPSAAYEETRNFIVREASLQEPAGDFTQEYESYTSPILSLLAKKVNGRRTPLAVVYLSLYPDADYESFDRFMRKSCKSCAPGDDFKKLYDEHRPEKQINIESILAAQTDRSPESLISLYRYLNPDASYQQTRAFIAAENPEIDSFKDFTKEYQAYKAPSLDDEMKRLVSLTDRSPEQLAALYGKIKTDSSYEEMASFILSERSDKKGSKDFTRFHKRYAAGEYDPAARYYKFDINDRGYLARPVHPLELEIAARHIQNPRMPLKQALAETAQERRVIYKWLIDSDKKKAQDRSIGIILDQDAWKEIEKKWKKLGFPFRLVPSLATVIGVSGDTADSLAQFNAILLNDGKKTDTIRFSGLHFGVGTPHETHITPGVPKTAEVMRPEVAELMLEMTAGVVSSERGTGRRLKEGFMLSNGMKLPARFKTGTNDETETLGIRVGAAAGTIGDRFAFCISGYITNASAKDKFTSGLAVQALKMLGPELLPLFNRSYGISPSPEGTLIRNADAKTPFIRLPERSAKGWPMPAKPIFEASASMDIDTGIWYTEKPKTHAPAEQLVQTSFQKRNLAFSPE